MTVTPADWASHPEFAAALKKALADPAIKLADQLIETFMSPTRMLLGAPDALLAEKPQIFLGQIKGFEMRKVAYEALCGDQTKVSQLETQYGVNVDELKKEVDAARTAAERSVSKPVTKRKKP